MDGSKQAFFNRALQHRQNVMCAHAVRQREIQEELELKQQQDKHKQKINNNSKQPSFLQTIFTQSRSTTAACEVAREAKDDAEHERQALLAPMPDDELSHGARAEMIHAKIKDEIKQRVLATLIKDAHVSAEYQLANDDSSTVIYQHAATTKRDIKRSPPLRCMSEAELEQLIHANLLETEDETIYDYLRDDIHLSKIFVDDINYLFEELKAAGQRFFTYSQLPFYLRDNDYIWTGYRAHYSFYECFRSMFQWHNETGNIWTHLLGALFFVGCMATCWAGSTAILPAEAQFADYFMMAIFLVSAIKCLLCSTIFHVFSAHAHACIYDSVAILDYTGISVLIFGSFLILINYGLYCHPGLKAAYMGTLGVLCGSGVVLPWFRFFRRSSFRGYRTLFFVTMGVLSGIITFHTIYLNGWHLMTLLTPMEYYVLEIVFYLLGALIYAKRVPEVWFPGKVDHVLHSHQIWHVFVFMGAFFHYLATVDLIRSRLTLDTCSPAFCDSFGPYRPPSLLAGLFS